METGRTIHLEGISDSEAMAITGSYDRNLKALSQAFETEISFRDNTFFIKECDEDTYRQINEVLDALAETDKEASMMTLLSAISSNNPRDIARQILDFACQCGGKSMDDMTVLAAGIWKK